jgi:hypothetical protein
MLIIIDHKLSPEAKKTLSIYGELMELQTEGITYPAISGHPDIFLCQSPDHLIVAPNLPEKYFNQLREHHIDFVIGEFPVGQEYPASARYNAVATSKSLIHNFRHTDFIITRTLEDLDPVHVDQGYCRCNLLALRDDCFITSDEGIYKVLRGLHPPVGGLHPISNETWNPEPGTSNKKSGRYLLVSPKDILLEGFSHGFFGGCCGVWGNKVFINGSLAEFDEGEKVRLFLDSLGYEIVELMEGKPVDVGGILVVEEKNW